MNSEYKWLDEYNIGVESLDREHRQLFRIINKLFLLKKEGIDNQWTCEEGIKFFKTYALSHFDTEEKYMASINYDGQEVHKDIHRGFQEHTLPALEKELQRENYSQESVEHFLGVCAGWFISHILTDDRDITGMRRNQRWSSLLPDHEQEDIKKVILMTLFNMFHLEASLISDTYGGEEFGNGIYYRLIWREYGKEEKLELFLVFEERLLISTIGKKLGIKTNKLNTVLLHAARYVSRQFTKEAMACFPDLKNYRLEEEELLSYKEFNQLMKKGTQQLSLLLDTGEGYFAYCMNAPHLLKTGIGFSILEENATQEVEKYLGEHDKQLKEAKKYCHKKILLVDDSATQREYFKGLLEKDYTISLADSGIAAIRAMTLNPPDLVLLDYEMPVCDGRQTLEMLRSEEAFAEIPVIFLTGKSDPQSVQSAMALKPDGYLLKSTKPERLRKSIDTFMLKQNASN